MFVFNRSPFNKEFFCDLLNIAIEADDDISKVFHIEPRMFDKIYLTMTDRELKSVAQRRGDPELVDCFPENDAIFSYKGRCIVLHIPAMAQKLSQIQFRPEDPEGKLLFAIHLFGCLFHELGHAYHYTKITVNAIGALLFDEKLAEFNVTELEKFAEEYEDKLTKRFINILSNKGLDFKYVADQLFEWKKLRPVMLLLRGEKDAQN
jgi:hypothetical protein